MKSEDYRPEPPHYKWYRNYRMLPGIMWATQTLLSMNYKGHIEVFIGDEWIIEQCCVEIKIEEIDDIL